MTIIQAASRISEQSGIPICVESALTYVGDTRISEPVAILSIEDQPVTQALDYITSQYGTHKWQRSADGAVINLVPSPIGSGGDWWLDHPCPGFRLDDMNVGHAVLELNRVLGTSEDPDSRINCSGVGGPPNEVIDKRITTTIRAGTIRDALNQIACAADKAWWSYAESHVDGRRVRSSNFYPTKPNVVYNGLNYREEDTQYAPAVDQFSAQCRANTGALMAVAALSPGQLSKVAAGEMLDWDSMEPKTRSAILDAAKAVLHPDLYASHLTNFPAGTHLGFEIKPEFTIYISSPALKSRRVMIPPDEVSPFLVVGNTAAASGPVCVNTMAVSDIISGAPDSQASKAQYLRLWAFELLAPIGQMRCLKGARVFTHDDIVDARVFPLWLFAAQEMRDWLMGVYARHAQLVAKQQALIRDWRKDNPDGEPSTVVCGELGGESVCADPATTPEDPLPAWFDMKDADAYVKVGYVIRIKALSGTDPSEKGVGWAIR